VVLAEGQNLYASVLLRPAIRAREVPVFSFFASLAFSDVFEEYGAQAGIKWPNDILLDGFTPSHGDPRL
jgi:BirA family biotin operon repressor/biotin-[acetyl-CoA-carboxylase] ligase